MKKENHEFMLDLKKRLETQNIRSTQDPYYCVQEKIYRVTEDGYHDDFEWYNSGRTYTANEEESETLEKWSDRVSGYGVLGEWRKVYVKSHWKTKETFISEKAAFDFIKHKNPEKWRTYGLSACNNPEMKKLRKFILEYEG